MTNEEQKYHDTASAIQDSVKSQLFGKPCYKMNGKAFCCFFQKEMVFKLAGDEHAIALNLDGSKLFDPSGKGRPMKAWVQVSSEHAEQWSRFAAIAASDFI